MLSLENIHIHKFQIQCKCIKEFEDIKWVIKIHKPKKARKHNDQKKKDKGKNNYPQNIHIKLKIE
jgi:hypothetical protein